MEDGIRKYGTPYDIERREKLQQILFKLYEEDTKSGNNKPKRTQTELGKMINEHQTTISRLLAGYKIDWSDKYKIKLVNKNNNESNDTITEIPIDEITKNITITKPSTFFISVGPSRKKHLENLLLKYFRSSKDKLGIIHIINIKNPSGLLIFSDDHNLEHHIYDNEYIQQIVNESELTENKKDSID